MITKDLQDHVWKHCLPKEFKEEVKKLYTDALDASNSPHEPDDRKWGNYRVTLLEKLFGIHNLTSDAEGEEDEMLCVSRKQIDALQGEIFKAIMDAHDADDWQDAAHYILDVMPRSFAALFGSKCLPDEKEYTTCVHASGTACKHYNNEESHCSIRGECKFELNEDNFASKEPKPAEPKFKVRDTVMVVGIEKYDGIVFPILDRRYSNQGWIYEINIHKWINEAWLEPYTEPEDLNKKILTCTDDCSSPGKESSKMKPIESRVSVYLATKEEDEEFRQLLHKNGFTWNAGIALISRGFWLSRTEEHKIHHVRPDKTVTYYGNRTSDTLTFSEFKKRYFGEDVNLSQETANCDKEFDRILKGSFSKDRRLNIAKDFVSVLLGRLNYDPVTAQILCCNSNGEKINPYSHIARIAVSVTDALIDEIEE